MLKFFVTQIQFYVIFYSSTLQIKVDVTNLYFDGKYIFQYIYDIAQKSTDLLSQCLRFKNHFLI